MTILATSINSYSQEEPDRNSIYIKNISYQGTGCPSGTVGHSLSADAQSFTIIFDEYFVEAYGEEGISIKNNKNCTLNVDLQAPLGWSYSLFSLQFRGYAYLDNKTKGWQSVKYTIKGEETVNLGKLNFKGPFEDDYQRVTEIPVETLVWSKCDKNRKKISIKTNIGVKTKGDGEAFLTMDSTDGGIRQKYGIIWKNCDEAKNKKFIASCKATLIKKKKNKAKREFIAKAKNNIKKDAKKKARSKALEKCERKRNGNQKLKCVLGSFENPEQPKCQVSKLRK